MSSRGLAVPIVYSGNVALEKVVFLAFFGKALARNIGLHGLGDGRCLGNKGDGRDGHSDGNKGLGKVHGKGLGERGSVNGMETDCEEKSSEVQRQRRWNEEILHDFIVFFLCLYVCTRFGREKVL